MNPYIQITTKCNQACEHCLFGCRPGVGSHMDWNTFLLTVSWMMRSDDHYYTFGGGEPTMHPDLLRMIEHVLNMDDEAFIWFATNGLNANRLWKVINRVEELNDIYGRQAIAIDLSVDYWHKYQDHSIRKFFTDAQQRRGLQSPFKTRDVSRAMRITNEGRAKRLGIGSEEECCGGYIIKPWGDIRACACKDAPLIGHMRNSRHYGDLNYSGVPISNANRPRWAEPIIDDWNWQDALEDHSCFKGVLTPEKGHRFI